MRIKALIFTALSFLAVINPLEAQATEPSDKQLSIGMSLAGRKINEIVEEACIKGGKSPIFCEYRGFSLMVDQGYHNNVYVMVKDTDNSNSRSRYIKIEDGVAYIDATLAPDEIRERSIKFAETILDRKLISLDPANPDTFYDPRDLSVNTLMWRVVDKFRKVADTTSCREQACEAFGYLLRSTGEYSQSIALKRPNEPDTIIIRLQNGVPLVDATVAPSENMDRLRTVIHSVLKIEPSKIVFNDRDNLIEVTPPVDAVVAASKRAVEFVNGKNCQEDKLFRPTEKDCTIGRYFITDDGNGDYTIQFKSDANSARPHMWIKQGTPFIKASLFDDDSLTSIHELVNTLTAKPNEVIQ